MYAILIETTRPGRFATQKVIAPFKNKKRAVEHLKKNGFVATEPPYQGFEKGNSTADIIPLQLVP